MKLAEGSSRCLDQEVVTRRKNATRIAASAVSKLEAELEQLQSEKEVIIATPSRTVGGAFSCCPHHAMHLLPPSSESKPTPTPSAVQRCAGVPLCSAALCAASVPRRAAVMPNAAVCVRQTKTVVMLESQAEVQDESAAYFHEVDEAKQRQADVEARQAAMDVDSR